MPDFAREWARDWATIWQSELAAVAADPETALVLEQLCTAWLDAAAALDAGRSAAGADAPARPAPAGAAAGARDAELDAMRARLAALEQRLARLDESAEPGAPAGPGSGDGLGHRGPGR